MEIEEKIEKYLNERIDQFLSNRKYNISLDTESYNEKRFGKPWVAVVDFSENPKGEYHFGDWIGVRGKEGTLEIKANPGDIIARGQKDHRGKGKSPTFYYVDERGNLEEIGDKGQAYKFWKKQQKDQEKDNPLSKFSDNELMKEVKRRGLI